jgi:hypothetical protein
MPAFQRLEHAAIFGKADIVRDLGGVIDLDVLHVHDQTLFRSKFGFCPEPYLVSAPSGPTAFGRWKIQFCHAVSRAKIFRFHRLGAAKRRFASIR